MPELIILGANETKFAKLLLDLFHVKFDQTMGYYRMYFLGEAINSSLEVEHRAMNEKARPLEKHSRVAIETEEVERRALERTQREAREREARKTAGVRTEVELEEAREREEQRRRRTLQQEQRQVGICVQLVLLVVACVSCAYSVCV